MYEFAEVVGLETPVRLTRTSALPEGRAGAMKEKEVGVRANGATLVPPTLAVMPVPKPIPRTVTVWPPEVGPLLGLTEFTRSGGPTATAIPWKLESMRVNCASV